MATLKSLLMTNKSSNNNNNNKIHLFGPYNRAVYLSLIELLEKDESLEVHSEWLELNRYRLAATATPPPHGRGASKNLLGQPPNNVDATSVIQHPYNDGHRLHHHHDNTHPSISSSKNNDCQTMQQLEDELREASKSTTKFLHVSATFRKNEPRNDGSQVAAAPRSTPLSDID